MPFADAYFALTDHLAGPETIRPGEFFAALTSAYPITRACYAVFEESGASLVISDFVASDDVRTSPESLRTRAPSRDLPEAFRSSVAPTEINAVTYRRAEATLGGGVGKRNEGIEPDARALVFPLACAGAARAVFAVVYRPGSDWLVTRRRLVRDLPSLAAFFHASRMTIEVPAGGTAGGAGIHLTNREREILEWVAAGKGYWEIATILGISQRTVRHFMASNRSKLDSVTNKQAVARAVYSGLIRPVIHAPYPKPESPHLT